MSSPSHIILKLKRILILTENNSIILRTRKEYHMTSSFIYKTDTFQDYVNFEQSVLFPVSAMIEQVDVMMEQYLFDREAVLFMGESADSIEIPVLEEGKSVFQSIGEAVENLLKKMGEMLSNLVEKVQKIFPAAKKKEKEEALKHAWTVHPELAQSFIQGISDGSIKYSDYENIDKMVDDAMKIIKDLETGRIESKTGVDKLNDVISNFNEKLTPAAELINTVGGVTRNVINIVGFKNKIEDEFFKRQKNQRKKDYFWAEARKETYAENSNERMTARTWRLKIAEKYTSEYSKTASLLVSTLSKLSSVADEFIGKDLSVKDMQANDRAKGRPGTKESAIRAQKANSLDAPYKPSKSVKKKGGKSR